MTRENIKYKTLTTIRYLGDGFFYPFFALYLVSIGLLEAKVGFILSISPLLAIIMNPIYSKICGNNVKKLKITLGVISILEGVAVLLIGLNTNFYAITTITIFLAMFGACHYGLMDSLVSIYADNTGQNYSGIRLYGSAAYIVATSSGGYLCKLVNYQLTFGICAGLFVISGFLYLFLNNIELDNQKQEKKSDFKDYKLILKNKSFVLFMIFYGISMGIIFTNNYFFPTYLETRGIGSDIYGLVYAYFVLVEVILLVIFARIKRKLSPYILLIIASLATVLRIIPCYFDAPIWVVISVSGLRGVGYAIMLNVSYQYVVDLLGEDKATKGIMLATLIYSISLFAFDNLNGQLIENYSYNMFFLFNLIGAVILLIYSVVILIYNKKKPKEIDLSE